MDAKLLRISVDRTLCQGHNRCHKLAPELIVLDDYGHASAVGDGVVPAEFAAKARLAEANCPEFAINLVESASEAGK